LVGRGWLGGRLRDGDGLLVVELRRGTLATTSGSKDSSNFDGKMGFEFTHFSGETFWLLPCTEEIKMAKTKTSGKQKKSKMIYLKEFVPYSNPDLKNPKLVGETLLDCIRTGDLEAFRDVLSSFIAVTNKLELAKKAGISQHTLYTLIDPKKKFNPELETVSAVIRALAG
jgi:DNA-binding phage protein